MSLLYQNNLMNAFLHKYNKNRFYSPKCECQANEDQNPLHVLTGCTNIAEWKRDKVINILDGLDYSPNMEEHVMLLSSSRNKEFVEVCLDIITEASTFLRKEIQL